MAYGTKLPLHGRQHTPNGADPIPGLSLGPDGDFLHWGTNNDTHSLGLELNADGTVVIDSDTFGIHLQNSDRIIIDGLNGTLQVGSTSGSPGLEYNGLTAVEFTTFAHMLFEAIGNIDLRSHNSGETGGYVRFHGDSGIVLDSNAGQIVLTHVTGGYTQIRDSTPTDIAIFGPSNVDMYLPLKMHGPTGATAATRFVGATTSGAPASGTFAVGDFAVAQNGHMFVCTVAGSPGTWVDVGSSGGPTGAAGGVLDGTYPNPGLAASVAGAGLAETSDVLSVNVDGSTIEINSDTLRVKASGITENEIALADVTSDDVSITKHGFVPKAPNDAAKFLRGDGTWATIGGTGTALVASDPIWDAKGDLVAATGADAAVKVTVGANGAGLVADSTQTAGVRWALGTSVLLYDYEVTGSDASSIDTNVDGAMAGLFSTDFRILEIWFYARTDEAAVRSAINVTVNNDSSSVYDLQFIDAINTTVAGNVATGQAKWQPAVAGANAAASNFSMLEFTFPNYAGTVGHKVGRIIEAVGDATATTMLIEADALRYRSTSAMTRLKFIPNTAGKKFKVGSRLSVFAR